MVEAKRNNLSEVDIGGKIEGRCNGLNMKEEGCAGRCQVVLEFLTCISGELMELFTELKKLEKKQVWRKIGVWLPWRHIRGESR